MAITASVTPGFTFETSVEVDSASVNINSPASVNNVKSGVPPPLGTPLAVEGRPALNDRSIANILHFVGYYRTIRKCDSGNSAIDCGIGG